MFEKVLIANRGAIAVRIIRTLKTMGIASVVVFHEDDRNSLHVKFADEAYSLGGGSAQDTYLNQDKLLSIAKQYQVNAIHPGYGFLSENASFCRRCEAQGIVFLGPTPEQMETFGLKHKAREIAEANGLPLLPGTPLLTDKDEALLAAEKITYPIILKSTAGGGGIGMQVCHSADDLQQAFDSVKRLSGNNFDNDGVFLEKYIASARHIEVQVLGDGQGQAISLGERDCSAQRRNQKVIEETPAPNLSEQTRQQLCQQGEKLLASIHYRSAGTVEFIVDQQTEAFYFLEVNTRLQVEHGVTEMVFATDIVESMILLGAKALPDLKSLAENKQAHGHAVQMRLYAENPFNHFQPSAGLVSQAEFPLADNQTVRIDHWLESGLEVSALFDPMLAKVICWGESREDAFTRLKHTLRQIKLYGIETNKNYILSLIDDPVCQQGLLTTRYLNDFSYQPASLDVLVPGTLSSLQDYPGRVGYWDVGVPPSGPFDHYAMRLGNRLLGNAADAAVMEITLNGPSLRFNHDTQFVLCGAEFEASLQEKNIDCWTSYQAKAGEVLAIGKVKAGGARCYLAVRGGFQCPAYLGSRSTFTLGNFGGHNGRALRAGDVLHLAEHCGEPLASSQVAPKQLPQALIPDYGKQYELRVIYGPQGAPDFFTEKDIETFFATEWEIHYNSSRTGIRLIGPKPEWARTDGGEAGMHPSNIHDNAYAVGAIDFTGDMPVILGPDGPSLGGFVCPATVVSADLWKLGQLKAGDKVSFKPISIADAVELEKQQQQSIDSLTDLHFEPAYQAPLSPVLKQVDAGSASPKVVYRPCGDHYLLIEYGEGILDINLRFRAHALMLWLQEQTLVGLQELTPGIRSLQIHYDSQLLPLATLMDLLEQAEASLGDAKDLQVPARIVHLPLSWNDEVCQLAVEKYMQSVRQDAPWCPDNLEFIRRINGLDSIDEVKRIVFDASYLVMGLGDVYLGAPVATPMDPRHRLVTTKYNPARTWTAENSVGIGGSYLCVYGMEGPGGYQFIGRTLQMWNQYHQTQEFNKPWLLRFFDQIRFYEVSEAELKTIRREFPKGNYPLKIEETTFSLGQYNQFIADNQGDINHFVGKRSTAFDTELQRWIDRGQFHFEAEANLSSVEEEAALKENQIAVDSHVAGNVWQVQVEPGDQVVKGQVLMIIESMKMEIEIISPADAVVDKILLAAGSQLHAGQRLLILAVDE